MIKIKNNNSFKNLTDKQKDEYLKKAIQNERTLSDKTIQSLIGKPLYQNEEQLIKETYKITSQYSAKEYENLKQYPRINDCSIFYKDIDSKNNIKEIYKQYNVKTGIANGLYVICQYIDNEIKEKHGEYYLDVDTQRQREENDKKIWELKKEFINDDNDINDLLNLLKKEKYPEKINILVNKFLCKKKRELYDQNKHLLGKNIDFNELPDKMKRFKTKTKNDTTNTFYLPDDTDLKFLLKCD